MDFLSQIPSEAVTGLISAGAGAWISIQKQKNETTVTLTNLAIAKLTEGNISANQAGKRDGGQGGNVVRRALALMAGAYIFFWPVIYAFCGLFDFGHEMNIVWLYPSSEGFWRIKDVVRADSVYGYVFTPLHTHLGSAAFFFYFGGTVGKTKR